MMYELGYQQSADTTTVTERRKDGRLRSVKADANRAGPLSCDRLGASVVPKMKLRRGSMCAHFILQVIHPSIYPHGLTEIPVALLCLGS